MYEIYQDEFYVSEQELKFKIHYYLQHLNIVLPEEFPVDLVQAAEPNKETSEILTGLVNIPFIQDIQPFFEQWDNETILRNIALMLCASLDSFDLESLFIKHFYRRFHILFLSLRYGIITQIITEKLNGTPITKNPGAIQKLIFDRYNNKDSFIISILASDEAEKEIQAFQSDSENQEYLKIISDFEYAVYEHIKKYGYNMCAETFGRAFFEGVIKNTDLIDGQCNFDDPLTDKEIKEQIKGLIKTSQQVIRERVGLKDGRGGKRERKGFVWSDENKIQFSEKVESLPKVGTKSGWKYALYELFDVDFAPDMISWLKSRPGLKEIPPHLFSEAVAKWRVFETREDVLQSENKPRFFEYRQALYLLELPDEFEFTTLDTYYKQGKKLRKN